VELRRDMWALVRRLRDDGVTIILTTHYIEEAEEMADRVGVINKGRLLLVEDKTALMQRFGKKTLTIDLTGSIDALPAKLKRDGLVLTGDGRQMVYEYDTRAERSGVARLVADLAGEGLAIRDLSTTQSTLEEVFLTLVKEDAA
jgi:ABC-2 type transport system ATP-binding protein